MAIVGAFLSTMLPPTGPATTELPARSKTVRVPVKALLVSVSGATLVVSWKLPSAMFARPERASAAEQVTLTSVACQRPSAVPQEKTGSVLSMRTVVVLVLSTLPQLSRAEKEIVVVPSALRVNEALAPLTVVDGIVCAPVVL